MAGTRVLRWAVCLVLVACTSDDGETGGDTGAEVSWPPGACALDESPFVQSECLDALRLACNAHAEESACAGAQPLSFDTGGYSIECGWAKVVAFVDEAACTVETVSGRCEARIDTECGDFCGGDDMLSDVAAIPSQGEIVQLCGGPLGPWSAVGAANDDLSTCADNVTPPSDALCECAEAACTAS
jgi:hypothetical protein